MHITEGALHRLAHTTPTTETLHIAFTSPSQPSVHRTGIPLHPLSTMHSTEQCHTYTTCTINNGKRAREETGGQPPDPRSCGGLPPILKAPHYPPVRIIHTTTQHIDTSYRVITSTNVARTHDPMPGMLRCCAANAAMLCSECCSAVH